MTMPADPRNSKKSSIGVIEVLASLAAATGVGALFLNYVGAHLTFFGEPVDIDPEFVRNYWVIVAFLALSVGVTFVAAGRRRASRALAWHSVVAVVGLLASLVFAVTETGSPRDPEPEPEPRSPGGGTACHSGGDSSECVGG